MRTWSRLWIFSVDWLKGPPHRTHKDSATCLEKEKRELEQALERSIQEFEAERSALQTRITALNEELQEKSHSQSRARAIQAELELAIVAKKQLEDELNSTSAETDHLKQKADEYSADLRMLLAKKEKEAAIEKSFRKNLLRRSLHNFKDAVEEQRIMCQYEHSAAEFAKIRSCRRGLHALQLATRRAAKIRQAQELKTKAGLEVCWRSWRLVHIAQKKYQSALQRRMKTFLSKTVSNWRSVMEMGKLSPQAERKLSEAAERHWRTITKKQCLKGWSWWTQTSARPRHQMIQEIQGQLSKLRCRQAFYVWKAWVRARRSTRLKKQQACFRGDLGLKRRAITRWLAFLEQKSSHEILNGKASNFYSAHQRKFVVACWANFSEIQRQKRLANAFAFRQYLHVLLSKGFALWKHNAKLQLAEQRAAQEMNQALRRACWQNWRNYLAVNAVQKKKEMKALVNNKRREKKTARVLLIFWWDEMAWRRRASQLTRLLSSRRRRTLLVNSLHEWIRATFDNLIVANTRFQNELSEAKALCDEQKQQTTVVDVENLQLIDRLHAMSSEIALLRTTISEKEKEEEELRRALEDGAVIEGSLQGDLEQQNMRIHELELDILNLQKKLQMKNLEDTAGEVHHTMEIQNLERTLKDLQTQLSEKSSQLESYEKALKDTAERLEGASDESQEKLTSAFEIAASLRRLLEDRENQCATLEGTCRRKELELNEIQRKLSAANHSYSEAIQARDARIHDLENILIQKQAEMRQSQEQYQELQRALDNKEASIRRLEYEMKLKSERESKRTKAFVSGLASWAETGSPKRGVPQLVQINDPMRSVYNQARAALQEGSQQHQQEQQQQQQQQFWSARQDGGTQRKAELATRWIVQEDEAHQLGVGQDGETEESTTDVEGEAEDKTRPPHGPYVTEATDTRSSPEQRNLSDSSMNRDDDAGKVESLHEEIQQLQARIISRLRDVS